MRTPSIRLVVSLCFAAFLAACADDGGDGQTCNVADFVGYCIDSMHYRTCRAGRMESVACMYGNLCGIAENGRPGCFGPSAATNTCQVPNDTQCNGLFVQTCMNGFWVNAPSPCDSGCTNGACNPIVQPAQCNAQMPCTDPGQECINNTCVAQTDHGECSDSKPCTDPGKVCVDNICVDQTGGVETCSDSNPCADPSKTCIYGECKTMNACSSNADCSEFNTLCSNAKCMFAPDVRCTKNDDCGPGFVCDAQTCLANNACSMTHTCPDKQICHNGRCQNTPHDTCSKTNPCADLSKTCIQGQCITCNCTGPNQTCDLSGNCVSTVHSDSRGVSQGDVCQYNPDWSFCDGNVLYSCSSNVGEDTAHVGARDCGAEICTNSFTEDLNCFESCSVKGDFYGECLQQYYDITGTFLYFAFKTECTESDDGRLIWTFTEGYESCIAGCTNGSCDPVPVEYGNSCQPGNYADRCIDQWAVACEADSSTGAGTVWGEDCAHYSDDQKSYSCAVSKDSHVSGCVLPCSQEGQVTTVCHKYPTMLTVYSESLLCAPTTDGKLGYFMTSYLECASGCNDDTGLCY